ncbi:MAG: sigma-70 family RNA polymerase sigma factor [Clostridia bacterium]|nr:sigma-70 family RNA polymerase sigma factor [Clostridia bacterium]
MGKLQEQGYSALTDEVLVGLASKGDHSAWFTIISRYLPIVKNRANGYISADFEGEDLVQEGFIGLFRAVKSYRSDGGSSFKTYAILCVDNSIISAVRKSLAKKRIPDSVIVPLDDCSTLPKETSAEDTYITQEEFHLLKETLSAKLSSFENDVFSLYLAGYDQDKISFKLSTNKKSVNNAISRIKRKIRDLG